MQAFLSLNCLILVCKLTDVQEKVQPQDVVFQQKYKTDTLYHELNRFAEVVVSTIVLYSTFSFLPK